MKTENPLLKAWNVTMDKVANEFNTNTRSGREHLLIAFLSGPTFAAVVAGIYGLASLTSR